MNHNHDVDLQRSADGTEWIVECFNCGQTFTSKRSDAAFCSAACRVSHSREPQKKLNAIESLKASGRDAKRIADRYRRSTEVFKAMQELHKQIGQALTYFEGDD